MRSAFGPSRGLACRWPLCIDKARTPRQRRVKSRSEVDRPDHLSSTPSKWIRLSLPFVSKLVLCHPGSVPVSPSDSAHDQGVQHGRFELESFECARWNRAKSRALCPGIVQGTGARRVRTGCAGRTVLQGKSGERDWAGLRKDEISGYYEIVLWGGGERSGELAGLALRVRRLLESL